MAASPATPSLAERAEEGDGGTEWFYVDGTGVRRGPHNFRVVRAQLRCGVLDGDDLVWREGLPAWRPAAQIPVFASCVAGRAGAAAASGGERDDAAPPERDDAATPDRARESAPVAEESLRTRPDRRETRALEPPLDERPHRPAPEPEPEDLSACWHASRSDGARFGPVDAETLVRLLAEAEAREEPAGGEGVETLVWHPRESAAWAPASRCPSLAEAAAAVSLRRGEDATGAAKASGDERRQNAGEGERSRLEALETELAQTKEALGSARFEIDALEAELASTRARAAEATALAREAARAAAATEDLAAARLELETKTAELSRLRGVLKGKLLARVLAEADDTRERVEELDALDAYAGAGRERDPRGEGAW